MPYINAMVHTEQLCVLKFFCFLFFGGGGVVWLGFVLLKSRHTYRIRSYVFGEIKIKVLFPTDKILNSLGLETLIRLLYLCPALIPYYSLIGIVKPK